MAQIGLLSGVFDPIHLGHIALAEAALAQLGLNEVWLLIDSDPSHKTTIATFEHRLAMAKRATAANQQIVADRHPVQRRAERRTLATAEELHLSFPRHEFSMIMGADAFARIDQWEGIGKLLQLVRFDVVARGDHPGDFTQLKQRLGSDASKLRVSLIDAQLPSTSSSNIRKQLSSGANLTGLHPDVYKYLLEQRLYR